jgi:hypothetical protein
MSTAPATAAVAVQPETVIPREVVVISHSTLFYWWPVWVVGYVMALITLIGGERMHTVPERAKVEVEGNGQKLVIVAPEGRALQAPHLHMAYSGKPGVIFAIVLLLVIAITSVSMRGLWSVIVILVIILMSIIFALLDVWDPILSALSWLDIRINLAGYLFISTGLLILWLVVFFGFDRQTYMIFTPGNVRLQLEIGDGETTYDTTGMTVQKQRSDLFRHWILGLGSGDLIVRTAGAQTHHFDLPNVLSISRRVREIEELLRVKQVVAAQGPPRH